MPKTKSPRSRPSAASSKARKSKAAKPRSPRKTPSSKPRRRAATATLDSALKSFKSEVRDRIAAGKPVTRAVSSKKSSRTSDAFAAREVQVRIAELEAKAAAAANAGDDADNAAAKLKRQLDRLKSRSKG